ncbi:putative magnesium transporter NIPA8 [Senna tora]|uniref:Probable magnesium transporter n=1 Tax=Senna tora TaxID=362788 RepID=A0A834TC45_9FABA|nr:putative magnesium transporter NIPA8 [Senna tora]
MGKSLFTSMLWYADSYWIIFVQFEDVAVAKVSRCVGCRAKPKPKSGIDPTKFEFLGSSAFRAEEGQVCFFLWGLAHSVGSSASISWSNFPDLDSMRKRAGSRAAFFLLLLGDSPSRSMGEWIVGAFINLFGSIAINFGTNLLKLGHNERERHSVLGTDGANGKLTPKPIIYFQTWRVGIVFFFLGNCLNFISFGYAAQSLLAALGSVQFVSNIAFAYFVLNKMVTVKVLVATAFIVLGNVFLVAFGNHQSPVYTPEQLAEKYSNVAFLLYLLVLILVVAVHHYLYRRGEHFLTQSGQDLRPYWHMLLPFSYAVVSGAVGSCSVLFAKSLSNLLRLAMSSGYQLHSWFTYSMLLLFLSTAGFWMARLNEGLSLFDAILIVPMFQIVWTFFSICTGFIYFQEYQVFDALRTTMFVLGMLCVFIGISLLAPDEPKGHEAKDTSLDTMVSSGISSEVNRLVVSSEEAQNKDTRTHLRGLLLRATDMLVKAKNACALSLGFGEDTIHASSVLVMPMMSSKLTGFRGSGLERAKILSMRNSGWNKIPLDEDAGKLLETRPILPESP